MEITFTKEFLNALDDWVAWCESNPRKMRYADNRLAQFGALIQLGAAQKLSGGPRRDPSRTAHPQAWGTPVPRITYAYWLGWRVRKIANAHWILTNDSREAFYIEFGLHRNPYTGEASPRRVRRPIMKKALKEALIFMAGSNLAHRVWADVFYPEPGEYGHRTKNIIWYLKMGGRGMVYTDLDAIPFGGGVGLGTARRNVR
jgi:hypothetical protein